MDGVIVGSDMTQEWLLPWWWNHYQKHNCHPVIFFDFGLSLEMKRWCKDRGEHIRLPIVDFAAEKEEMDPILMQNLEKKFGTLFWSSRNAWFKKPFACLKSPFQRTIWVDLDCEIRGSISPTFTYADDPPGLAMARDPYDSPAAPPLYNSGVIVFSRNALPLFADWADHCYKQQAFFRGDQEIFSHLIDKKGLRITELPLLYNWSRSWDDRPNTVIRHWHGVHWKWMIKNQLWQESLS